MIFIELASHQNLKSWLHSCAKLGYVVLSLTHEFEIYFCLLLAVGGPLWFHVAGFSRFYAV